MILGLLLYDTIIATFLFSLLGYLVKPIQYAVIHERKFSG